MAERDLRRKLFWLIAIRVGISSLLLGSAVFVQLTSPGTSLGEPLFLLIGVTYALNILWTLTLKWAERYRWIVDVQLACDALIVSGFIAVTGGITSYFAALYVLPIAAASSVQFRRGGMMIATLSALLYLGIVLTQYFGLAGLLGVPFLDLRRHAAAAPHRGVHHRPQRVSVFLDRVPQRIARRSTAARGRAPRARVERDRRPSGVQPACHRQPGERAGDDRPSGAHPDVQSRRRGDYRPSRRFRWSAGASKRCWSCRRTWPTSSAHLSDPSRGRRIETSYRTGDGRQIELGFTATPLQTPGGNAGLLFAFQDVTDIKKLERDARLRQRLAAVGEMAAGIAHEIRNPLASMSGSIQILRQELPLTEEQAQLMDIVLRESERLNDTIRSFLAYARPQRFSIARLDVRRVLNDAAVLLRNSSEVLEGHVIDVRVPPTEVAFEADENQIRQIVWNLATNGLRAMRNGGRLTLGARIDTGGEPVARVGRARGVGRGRRDSRRRARRDLPAVSRHVLERHRPGARDRAPHRQRLRRRDSTSARRRAAGRRSASGCRSRLWRRRREAVTKNENENE